MFKRFTVLFACLLIVNACAAKKHPSSKPPQSDKKIKASQKPYTVFGQRYEPMRSHEGFVQTGIASWYGRDFHGKTTSNGERYDMHAMTAAHKTLPLGVYVRVQNRDNGRELIVRVNDRGPFVKGRVIDLSYAAAIKLGVDILGTAPVRVEALGFQQDGKEGYKTPDTFDSGNYSIQIGSFKDHSNAKRLAEEMQKRLGFSDLHLTNVNGDLFYRVYAGRYDSLQSAESAEKDFSEQGYPGSFAVSLD